MWSRCLVCYGLLPRNELIEAFPYGPRIAFDPVRGRLWAVCESCHSWILAPIEDRWAAIEELEGLVSSKGRVLREGDNISLSRLDSMDVIRVGRTERVEEAWWRYGTVLRKRRWPFRVVSAVGATVMGAASNGSGVDLGVELSLWLYRKARFDPLAWKGLATCEVCGGSRNQFKFEEREQLILCGDADRSELALRCRTCSPDDVAAGYRFGHVSSGHVLRRVMAYHNVAGASRKELADAASLVEGGWRQAAYRAGPGDNLLLKLRHVDALALEMAVNDEIEREVLAIEVSELEERWKEQEALARIVDDELAE